MPLQYRRPDRSFCRLSAVVALLILFLASVTDAVDLDFITAYQRKNARVLQRYVKAYKDTFIEPYIIARTANDKALSEGKLTPELVGALDRFAGVPPIEEMRASALKAWARRGDWKQFAAHFNRVPEWLADQDMELKCAEITYLRSQQRQVTALRARLFSRLTEFPSLCAPAFAGAEAAGEIGPQEVTERLMYLGSLGKMADAHRLAATFSSGSDTKGSCNRTRSRVLEVLSVARRDFRKGLASYGQHKELLDAETARGLLIHIGVIAARNLEPVASSIIGSVDGFRCPLQPAAAEWRTRAALLSGAWADVLISIETMPSTLRDEPVWKYWRARSFDRLSRTEEARLAYAELSRQPGYYGILAAERLEGKPPYLRHDFTADLSLIKGFETRPEVARALALHKAGLWIEAARELNILMRGAESGVFYAAAVYAKNKGLTDRQISFAQRATDHFDLLLRHPLLYGREVSGAAEGTGLSPALLWAVIRQESRFVPHAVSSSGAVGLMQVMPATAKHMSGSKRMSRDALTAPHRNIALGASFLKTMYRRYDGNDAFAAAAYNAGPGKVDRWRKQMNGIETERFIELISITETRDYTKQVLANYVFYSYALGREPISLSALGARQM